MHVRRRGECLKLLHFEFLNLPMKITRSNTPKQWQRTFGCFVDNKDPPCVFGQSWCLVQQKRLTARGQLSLPLIKHTCGLALMYHLQTSWTFIRSSLAVFQISPLDLSSTSNCSGCLDVTLYSKEISRLKREFEDIQRMILGQEQVSWRCLFWWTGQHSKFVILCWASNERKKKSSSVCALFISEF